LVKGEGVGAVTLRQLQEQIRRTYFERDTERGLERTFLWFVEEVGELARLLKSDRKDAEALRTEFSDVLAWLLSVANLAGVDIQEAAQRYADGCPKCRTSPCRCPMR
jgi:NTP pyrophosphatase (non-canonical NTP hydrolase)